MKKKSKLITLIVIIISELFAIISIPILPVAASDICSNSSIPEEVKEAAGCNGNTNALPTTIEKILESIIAIAGTISVIYIVVGGIQYMTSAGDTSKIEKAKKTILYACIGLIICALAFTIVNWTISAIPNTTTESDESSLLHKTIENPIAFYKK